MNTPEQIKPHAGDYKDQAWKQYTIEELEWWVKLLTKRASHRTDETKRNKDLYDADNYQAMLNEARKHEETASDR